MCRFYHNHRGSPNEAEHNAQTAAAQAVDYLVALDRKVKDVAKPARRPFSIEMLRERDELRSLRHAVELARAAEKNTLEEADRWRSVDRRSRALLTSFNLQLVEGYFATSPYRRVSIQHANTSGGARYPSTGRSR